MNSTGKIVDVSPLAPMILTLESNDENNKEMFQSILFLDQSTGKIYDFEGPVNDNMQAAVFSWLKKKQDEVQKEMNSALMKATPDQLRAMGIDPTSLNRGNSKESKLII